MQAYLTYMDKLDKRIAIVSREVKLQLAMDICKKLYPDYVNYSLKHSFGDPTILQQAIAYLEDVINTKSADHIEIKRLKVSLDNIIPDTKDFQGWDCSYALNACAAVCELLEFIKDSSDKHISDICSLMIDTVDFKIAEENEHISDDGIFKHPQMLSVMNEMLEKLKRNV